MMNTRTHMHNSILLFIVSILLCVCVPLVLSTPLPFVADLSSTHVNMELLTVDAGTFTDIDGFTFTAVNQIARPKASILIDLPTRYTISITINIDTLQNNAGQGGGAFFMMTGEAPQSLWLQITPDAHPQPRRLRTSFMGFNSITSVDSISTFGIALESETTITVTFDTNDMSVSNGVVTDIYTYTNGGSVATTLNTNDLFIGSTDGTNIFGMIHALSITAPASGIGDPQFIGFHGQQYQIHGFPATWFNIITSQQLSVNARFTYLANGDGCQYNNTACWTHPGTYMDAFGITLVVDDTRVPLSVHHSNHSHSHRAVRLSILAGPHTTGLTITLNDSPFPVGTTVSFSSHTHTPITISYPSFDHLRIHTNNFQISLMNAHEFINMETTLIQQIVMAGQTKIDMRNIHGYQTTHRCKEGVYPDIAIHGLLGQTWRNAIYAHGQLYEGSVDDYICSGQFKYDSVFNSFGIETEQQ